MMKIPTVRLLSDMLWGHDDHYLHVMFLSQMKMVNLRFLVNICICDRNFRLNLTAILPKYLNLCSGSF